MAGTGADLRTPRYQRSGSDGVTNPALLERVLTLLREWEPSGPPAEGPRFGAICRRARPSDQPADVTLPH
jgi:hypothetical protein